MRRSALKRKPQRSKTETKGKRGQKAVGDLEKVLLLIRKRPGIRPSEINRLLKREESDGLRATLIKRGLIRKQRDGSAIRYYPA